VYNQQANPAGECPKALPNNPTNGGAVQNERLSGKGVFFVRINQKGVSEKTVESDLTCGEVTGGALENFKAFIADLYSPLIQEQQQWGKVTHEHADEFKSSTYKFGNMLTEAVATVSGGVELRKPEQRFVDQYDLKPASLNAAAADEQAIADAEEALTDWCKATEELLAQTNRIKVKHALTSVSCVV
jgi:dynein heavy chain